MCPEHFVTRALVTAYHRIAVPPETFPPLVEASSSSIAREYFVPSAAFAPFLARMRAILLRHDQDLLRIAVRNVTEDHDAFLRYADQAMCALVLLFNHARAPEADATMSSLTRDLVDAALSLSGRHYLPYRLHATPAHFARAYPQAAQFFAAKRRYDPDLVFRNHFWDRYGA